MSCYAGTLFLYAVENPLKTSYFNSSLTMSVAIHKASNTRIQYPRLECFPIASIFSITALSRLESSSTPRRDQHAGCPVSNQGITLPSVHSTASSVRPCSRENKREYTVIHDLKAGSHQANRDKYHRNMLANQHWHRHLLLLKI